jgi:uncharacterized protein YndB with AHSA1/START domain
MLGREARPAAHARWASACTPQPMEFFVRYIEVTPHSRLVLTNGEGEDGGAITTVTFEEEGGKTLLVMHDLFPSKEALYSKQVLCVVFAGDARLPERLRSPELLPLGSRIRRRIVFPNLLAP